MDPSDAIGSLISTLLMYILYPAMMVGMILWLIFAIRNLIVSDYGGSSMRRIAAALLPITFLMFFIVLTRDAEFSKYWEPIDSWFPLLCFGGGMGFILMLTTSWFAQQDEELAPVMHSFILSLILSFILYCIVESTVHNLQFFFLGMIMACCLYIMFRGTDDLGVMKGPRTMPPPAPPEPRFRQTSAPPARPPLAPTPPAGLPNAPAQVSHQPQYVDPAQPGEPNPT